MGDVIALEEWKAAELRKNVFHVPADHPKWAAWMVMRVHVSKAHRFVDQDVVDSIVAEVVIGTRRVGKSWFFGDMPLTDDSIAEMYERVYAVHHAETTDDIEVCWQAQTRCMAIGMMRQLLESEIDDVSDVAPHDMAILHATNWSVQ